jgi:hypothetical protein
MALNVFRVSTLYVKLNAAGGVEIRTYEQRKQFNSHLFFMTFICFVLRLARRYLKRSWGSLIICQRKVFLYHSLVVTGFLTLFRVLWSALNYFLLLSLIINDTACTVPIICHYGILHLLNMKV